MALLIGNSCLCIFKRVICCKLEGLAGIVMRQKGNGAWLKGGIAGLVRWSFFVFQYQVFQFSENKQYSFNDGFKHGFLNHRHLRSE